MNITIGLISFFISFVFLYFSREYYLKHNLLDVANKRSSHNAIATRNGGVSVYLTLLLISIYFYINGIEVFDYTYLIPLSILLIVGLYDDVYDVDFKLKFIFQIITAKILIDNGVIIDNFHGLFGINELNRIFAQVFSYLSLLELLTLKFYWRNWWFSFCNINIPDFIWIFCLISNWFFYHFNYFNWIFCALLYFNFRSNNKIFLGDSGSLFLGGIVSIYVFKILSSD